MRNQQQENLQRDKNPPGGFISAPSGYSFSCDTPKGWRYIRWTMTGHEETWALAVFVSPKTGFKSGWSPLGLKKIFGGVIKNLQESVWSPLEVSPDNLFGSPAFPFCAPIRLKNKLIDLIRNGGKHLFQKYAWAQRLSRGKLFLKTPRLSMRIWPIA